MLRGCARRLAATWSTSDGLGPRARILAVFDAVREVSASPDFHGCPFVNVATELKDREHPASLAALGYKLELNRFFEDQARAGGAADPEALGVQLTIVFDGASSAIYVNGTSAASGDAGTGGLGNAAITIGWHPSVGGREFSGDVYEFLIYDHALTTNERATAHSYAQDTYGVTVADYVVAGRLLLPVRIRQAP
jgi:hypothetical protein